MRHYAVCVLNALALLCLSLVFVPPAAALPVCVAAMQGAGGPVSPTASRSELMKVLGKEKNLQLEGVPLDTLVPEEALTQAKEKKCDYVVTTDLREMHSSSEYTMGASGANLQTFYVTVGYKLNQVSDGAELTSGSFKASDRGSQQNAVDMTLKKVADKVAEVIKKGPGSAK